MASGRKLVIVLLMADNGTHSRLLGMEMALDGLSW
ncbi:hypothetical protein MES5069_240005 [Mesorhizobium escarrei]|uniref:Uncharacterized protein n=1 Tax=Mesorhizobium escarrei TaxID=666018 RepID=A0ABN8JQR0_9HYPH|nr:hypothetical protein MES5069_240005 [Mesorhizobium escarrei]